MNGLYRITPDQMERFISGLEPVGQGYMRDFGRLSNPLFAGIYDDSLLCLVGLIPKSLMSDEAYIWCYSTADVAQHKVKFGRHAKRLMTYLLTQYPRIVGHCLDQNSWRWLQSLGAKSTSPTTFEISPWQTQ